MLTILIFVNKAISHINKRSKKTEMQTSVPFSRIRSTLFHDYDEINGISFNETRVHITQV